MNAEAATIGHKWGRSELSREWVAEQVCTFRCTHNGCTLTYIGTLADWLPLRDAHRRAEHCRLKVRKRPPAWLVQREEQAP